MMKKYSYVKLLYKQSIDDWAVIHLSELDEKRYEIRAVDIYNNNKYGYAYDKIEYNSFLSDCPVPTISDFYNSGEYDTDSADCLDITKEEFESEWKKAVEYCRSHNIIPLELP